MLEGGGGYCSLMLGCQTDHVADELRSMCSNACEDLHIHILSNVAVTSFSINLTVTAN